MSKHKKKQLRRKKKKAIQATVRQKKAIQALVENGGSVADAMRVAKYSEATINTPQKLTESKAFQELAGDFLSDRDLLTKHKRLLNAHRLDHMIFPLGPKEEGEETDDEIDDETEEDEDKIDELEEVEHTSLTDIEITQMLNDLNCSVRKIVHGRQARHVYFWSPDNKAQQAALALGYTIRGKLKDPGAIVPIQININEDRNKYS